MFWMRFNDNKNTDFDVQVVERPNIPVPKKRVSYVTIPGKNGTLTKTDGTYENIQFDVKLNFLTRVKESFMQRVRVLKMWLSGSGELKFSDDPEVFYKVKNVSISNQIERQLRRAGFFTASFTCDPFTYFESGRVKTDLEECKVNPYFECCPTYYLNGYGQVTLSVNGYQVNFTVDSNVIINTDLMIMYKESGELTKVNTIIDYDKLRFKNGYNELSMSGEGVTLKIEPNWRSL